MLWFERKFSFDLPEWTFPLLLERVRGTPARLEDRLDGVLVPVLTECHEGKWSIQENAGHLLDLEPLWAGRIEDVLAGLPMRPADLSNTKTREAGHNAQPLDTILQEFREVRSRFVSRLESLSPEQRVLASKHPRLEQTMRILDLVYFVAEHDDHHLARISRLLRRSPGAY